jgi:ParB-like nuclease domain
MLKRREPASVNWFSQGPPREQSFAIESTRLTVTYLSVSDLTPDPRNARTNPKRQIDHIRASIEAFGFTNPIPADPDGRIIASRSRLQAARLMGPRPAAQRSRGGRCRLTNFHAGQ